MTVREEKAITEAGRHNRNGRPSSVRSGLGAGAPMTASFIGLLMLGSIRPSEAEASEDGVAMGLSEDESGAEFDGAVPQMSGAMAASPSAVPNIAVGSVLTVGDYVEPLTVAQMAGTFILAEPSPEPWAPPQSSAGPLNLSNQVDADVSVALGSSAAAAGVTEVALDGTDDENLDAPGQSFDGTDGDDTLVGTELADRMLGGDGDDTISGNAGDDIVYGGLGRDELHGGAGDDEMWGGNDDDRLEGGDGNDSLYGDAGDDVIEGGAGIDRLEGGAGDDRLIGGEGSDHLVGGPGDDTMVIDSVTDIASENDEGEDRGGNDTLEVDALYAENTKRDLAAFAPDGEVTFAIDDDLTKPLPDGVNGFRHQIDPDIENVTLYGDADHDIIGNDKDNVLTGNDGDNQIYGGLGDDALWGSDGEDILYGEEGDDILFGGEGDDIYLLGLAESGTDTIFDHQGSNLLRLDGADPSTLSARLDGNTLVLEQSGAEIVRINDYASKPESFEGVEIDGNVTPISDYLSKPAAVEPVEPQEDLLGDFLDEPNDPPPSAASAGELELPAVAVIEPEPIASTVVVEQPPEQADMLASFMADQEIWTTGDEQSFYNPGALIAGDNGSGMEEAKDARA